MGLIKIDNDYPLDHTLCMFKMKTGAITIGYMDWLRMLGPIKEFSTQRRFEISEVDSYQYLYNEKGGLIWISKTTKHEPSKKITSAIHP